LKGGTQGGQILQTDILNDGRFIWPETTKFGTITHMEKGHMSKGSSTPHHTGGGAPALPKFGCYLLFMRTLFDAELLNFTR